MRDIFEEFVSAHPRQPHPSRISWEAGPGLANNRAHWLVIHKMEENNSRVELVEDDFTRPGNASVLGSPG